MHLLALRNFRLGRFDEIGGFIIQGQMAGRDLGYGGRVKKARKIEIIATGKQGQ
jgi:hypothetical protein